MHEQFHGPKLRERGYLGTNQDIWWYWLETKNFIGPTADAEMEWLTSLGYTEGSLQDRYFKMYRDAGLTGTLDDMGQKWDIPEGGITPPPTDPVEDPLWDDVVFFWNGELGDDAVIGGTGTRDLNGAIEESPSDLFGTNSAKFDPDSTIKNCISFQHPITIQHDQPLTIDLWARSTHDQTNNYPSIMWFNDGTLDTFYLGMSNNRGMVLGASNIFAFTYTGSGSVPLDQWVHLAWVFPGDSTVKLFINGVLNKVATINSRVFNATQLAIGSRNDRVSANYPFTGRLDEVRITNAARWLQDFTPPSAPVLVP